ncbi:CGNR zinc finger domain-containing protein [Streptomyces sp. NPDC058773]|uniref:CGNR zinc finger domain-containing protein n=1 Tax=Streptomyces sp. NPDC058773 TaxID=3346632 RepID=UPI0036BB10AD
MNLDHVFVCGNPALDFAATLRARRTTRFEMFATADRLDAWYVESGIVDSVSPARQTDVDRATTVREAVYQLIKARCRDADFDDEALTVVNDAARKAPAAPQLTRSGRWTAATQREALSTVARHAVELLSGPDVPLLKECGNPECTRVYIDRSRGSRRQWCGMESCGNKIKAAAYRARRKTAVASG